MKRAAGILARVVFGLAAIAFGLGALLFLLGLHLTLVPLRVRQHAQMRLVLELVAGIAALVQLSRPAGGDAAEPKVDPAAELAEAVRRAQEPPQG